MPVEYQIYDNGKYIYAKASGKLTPKEIIDYVKKTKANTEIKDGHKELFDVRFITESKVTIESFAGIIKEVIADEKRMSSNKIAIVASRLELFDKAKFYEKAMTAKKQNIIVFNTIETAKTWLGVDKPLL
jgi:hypothetical protein